MSPFKPWHILQLDLSQGITKLSIMAGIRGVYIIFWWHDIPLGEIKIVNADLPLTASQVVQLALKSITPSVRNYLMDDIVATRLQGNSGSTPQAELLEFVKTAQPLEMIWGKSLLKKNPEIPISVVICTRDRSESLKRCLNSLYSLTMHPLEILVVDNAPESDETRGLVSSMPGIRYILEPVPGLDFARNAGIHHSASEIIAFIDDDVVVHPNWLTSLQRAFQDQQIMAVTGLVLPGELETEAQYIFETHWSFNRGYHAKTYDTKYFKATWRKGAPVWEIGAGTNMAFRRRAFDLVGLFDERLDVGAAGCSGDSEFWYRLLAEGCCCRYEPTSVVYHYHRRDVHSLKRQIFYYMRGHVTALLIQFERYKHWGNIRRILLSLPRYYIKLVRNVIFGGLDTRARTVVPEIAGCLSGVKFYLLRSWK